MHLNIRSFANPEDCRCSTSEYGTYTSILLLLIKPHLARLIQNSFTGEARKTAFSRLLVHFNPGLQDGFTLQCLDLRKIDEAEAGIRRAKEAFVCRVVAESLTPRKLLLLG